MNGDLGDVFVYKNRAALAATHSRLGHEGSGLVAGVGRGVTGLAPGDVVTTLGEPAYAEYFVTTPDQVVKLPPEIDPVLAAECLGSVLSFMQGGRPPLNWSFRAVNSHDR